MMEDSGHSQGAQSAVESSNSCKKEFHFNLYVKTSCRPEVETAGNGKMASWSEAKVVESEAGDFER